MGCHGYHPPIITNVYYQNDSRNHCMASLYPFSLKVSKLANWKFWGVFLNVFFLVFGRQFLEILELRNVMSFLFRLEFFNDLYHRFLLTTKSVMKAMCLQVTSQKSIFYKLIIYCYTSSDNILLSIWILVTLFSSCVIVLYSLIQGLFYVRFYKTLSSIFYSY